MLEGRTLLAVGGVAFPTFQVWHPKQTNGQVTPFVSSSPTGLAPANMRHAYGLDVTSFMGIAGDGTGQTIAIVDAYNEPTIVNDLAAFDSYYSLAAPPSFTVVNQTGGTTLPSADTPGGWGVETALDVEWAHVMAPKASILLVAANSSSLSDLYTAVDTARNWPGVSVVSMSWGANETSTSSNGDTHFVTPSGHTGVTFVASSGDYGAYGTKSSTSLNVSYPAVSKNVVGIGGTTLTTGSGGSYTSESGWGYGTSSNTSGGSGGGISQYIAQPSFQSGVVTQSTTRRTVPDVSFDADPNSGVPVYSAYDNGSGTPWLQVGGTSLAAPMWAGVMSIIDQGRAIAGLGSLNGPTETLPKLYGLPSSDFHDVTTGNNGYAAGPGYDLVTGIGTPIVNKLAIDMVGAGTPTVGSFTTGTASVSSGGAVSLYASNVTDAGGSGTISSVTFYRESNGTAGFQADDALVGTATKNGSTWEFSAPGLADGTYTFYAVASDGISAGPAVSTSITIGGAGFGNWSTLSQIISKVPLTVTLTPSTSVISNGTTYYTGQVDVSKTLDRIRANNGAITASDGGVFVNSTGLLLPTNRGSFYEFNVDPQTGSVPSFTTAQIAPPGPMRLLIDAGGDVYFSGDLYASDVSVYTGTLVVPTIGSFAASPAAVSLGSPTTLTASNVSEAGGTVSSVSFYRESNGIAGLQPGTDTLVGTGTASGTTWTLSTPTSALTAGNYTFYALATDTSGNTSTVSSATLSVIDPNAIAGIGGTVLAWNMQGQNGFGTQGLTATTIATGATNSTGLTRGSGVTTSGTAASNAWGGKNWSLTNAADGLAAGDYVTFGFTISSGYTTSLSSISLNYRHGNSGPPNGSWQYQLNGGAWNLIGDFASEFPSTSSSGGSITPIPLAGIADLQNVPAGTVVNFRVVPYGASNSSGSWYVYDGTKNTDDLVISATAVPNGTPSIGSVATSAATVIAGSSALLSANSVAEVGGNGSITGVNFYRESNGTSALQVGSDTLVGAGIQSGSTWLISTSTSGLAGGTYTYYAVATDSNGASSVASSTTLTVVPPTTVVGRSLFYNNSSLDGNDPTANALDDNAIAADKSALLPGQTGSAANVSAYSRGINGLMLDLTPLPAHATITAADFAFSVGNDNTPSAWAGAPAPSQVLVRSGAGTGGADRIEIIWPDGSIVRQWLQVTVLANADTGLASPDVFYFGSLPGDANGDLAVGFADLVAVSQHYGTAATGPSQADFNVDGQIGFADLVAVSQGYGASLTAITPAVPAAVAPAAAVISTADSTASSVVSSPASTPNATGPTSNSVFASRRIRRGKAAASERSTGTQAKPLFAPARMAATAWFSDDTPAGKRGSDQKDWLSGNVAD